MSRRVVSIPEAESLPVDSSPEMVRLAIPLFTILRPFLGVLLLKSPIKVGTALMIGDSILSISSVF